MRPFVLLLAFATMACGGDPIRIEPDNPNYFLFRGKPLVLMTAAEHFGSIVNRAFDLGYYLNDAAEHNMTLTRTFLLFPELR